MSRASPSGPISKAICELLERNYTEQAIADALREKGIEISQSTIHRIKTGEIEDPRFRVGAEILRLREGVARRSGASM